MSSVYTNYQKRLATINWVAGTSQAVRLDNVGIYALVFNIKATGTAAPTVLRVIEQLDRVLVDISGQDDVAISGWALYAMNRRLRGGAEIYTETTGTTRWLQLTLPFIIPGGTHPGDTLLDLRRNSEGSLPQASIRFDMSVHADVSVSSTISVNQLYYSMGDHERKVGGRRQLREKLVDITDGNVFSVPLEYGGQYDDLLSIWLIPINASALVSSAFEEITLTATEPGVGTFNVFNILEADTGGLSICNMFEPSPLAVQAWFDQVFRYDFCRSNGQGNDRSLKGLLDASSFSNLVLSGIGNATATVHILLDRLNGEGGY